MGRPLVGLLILAAMACSAPSRAPAPAPASPHLVERTARSMGTDLALTAWTEDGPHALAAFDAVFAEFDRLDHLMSVWHPESDIVRLNAAAGQHPVMVSREVLETLTAAREISVLTDGKFDVTFGALSGLWKFDHDRDDTIPDRREIETRLPLIDYRDLELDASAHTAFLKRKGMSAHLGGIGKGYAVDRAADLLRRAGLRNFMIQAGGDLYVAGKRGDRPWRLGLRDPRGPADRSFAALDLSDGTFSTSGDYERFFIRNGRRYHHLLDPDRGEPAQGTRSVTIVANRATLADGLSTGVFLIGPEAGMALIERLPDVEGVIVTAKNEVLVSSGLRTSLLRLAPPTDAP